MRVHPSIALIGFVFVCSTYAVARMEPGDPRVIAYQGTLELNGVPANGPVAMRFGLFTDAAADASCLTANNCTLFSEEQNVDVVNSRFSVKIGDSNLALSDNILESPRLFLAIAVKGPADTGFSVLSGKQEILPAPLAVRAATAKNYVVTGDATIAGNLTANSVTYTTLSTSILGSTAVNHPAAFNDAATFNGMFNGLGAPHMFSLATEMFPKIFRAETDGFVTVNGNGAAGCQVVLTMDPGGHVPLPATVANGGTTVAANDLGQNASAMLPVPKGATFTGSLDPSTCSGGYQSFAFWPLGKSVGTVVTLMN